jgi:cysteinyl-tRNA synthetase
MISVNKTTDNQPAKKPKKIEDVKKAVVDEMLAQMEKLNKKPLTEDEKAATQKLAEMVAQTSNLKDMGVI